MPDDPKPPVWACPQWGGYGHDWLDCPDCLAGYEKHQSAADLYTPSDVVEAYEAWRATCGPAALAAVLGRPVTAVRDLLPGYKGWSTPTLLRDALTRAGVRYSATPEDLTGSAMWPAFGLAFVQIAGPWIGPGVPPKAAYRHTHWCGVADGMVYDINDDTDPDRLGGWLPKAEWGRRIIPRIVASHKRATGWYVRAGIEVLR